MEHLKHRTEAKVVAIINLILSGITLAVITIFSIYILSRVAALPPSSKDPADAIDDHTKVCKIPIIITHFALCRN